MLAGVDPTRAVGGERSVTAGAGLSTSRLTGAPVALERDPFTAITESVLPSASWLAGSRAVSWPVPTKVVGSMVGPT